jgi:Tfp pilus assembly protein PilV
MKFATQKSEKWQVTSDERKMPLFTARHSSRVTHHSAFTLAEVLAALLFLAIVIPTAVEALHVASLSGEVAVRKSAAARVADRVLNENLVTTNWNHGTQSGTTTENGIDYRWTLTSQSWQVQSALSVVTTEVKFSAQGKEYAVTLNTLANPTPVVTGMN